MVSYIIRVKNKAEMAIGLDSQSINQYWFNEWNVRTHATDKDTRVRFKYNIIQYSRLDAEGIVQEHVIKIIIIII